MGLPTPVWGYGRAETNASYPGPTLVAPRDRAFDVHDQEPFPEADRPLAVGERDAALVESAGTGRGVRHAEGVGADEEGTVDTEFRGVLFWVNLARKDKHVEPHAQVLAPEEIPVRQEGDATIRVLVGEGSPIHGGGADR